jgi:phosphate:Na+ symporter
MASLTLENITEALSGIENYEPGLRRRIEEREEKIDSYEGELTEYLHKIGMQSLLDENHRQMNMLLYCIRDLERISDHACNIISQVSEMAKTRMVWKKKAKIELREYASSIQEIVRLTVSCFVEEDVNDVWRIEQMEKNIDIVNKQVKRQTVKRLKKEKYSPETGLFVNELAINFERIADHCENIAFCLQDVE